MLLKPHLSVGYFLCLYLLTACGPSEFGPDQEYMPEYVPPETALVEDEDLKDANLVIETTYRYGGLASPYHCSDGAYGRGGTSNLLTNDGNNYSWIGAWRNSLFTGDPNGGMRCSTSREYFRAIEPNSWINIKKEILNLKLQKIAGHYSCNRGPAFCPSDVSYLSHDITIDDQRFTISWTTGIGKDLPTNLRRLNDILQMLDPPWSDG